MVLNEYTEVTVVNVNGKLYVKTVTADGVEEFSDCDAVHLATSEDDLVNLTELAPACHPYKPLYDVYPEDLLREAGMPDNWPDSEI